MLDDLAVAVKTYLDAAFGAGVQPAGADTGNLQTFHGRASAHSLPGAQVTAFRQLRPRRRRHRPRRLRRPAPGWRTCQQP